MHSYIHTFKHSYIHKHIHSYVTVELKLNKETLNRCHIYIPFLEGFAFEVEVSSWEAIEGGGSEQWRDVGKRANPFLGFFYRLQGCCILLCFLHTSPLSFLPSELWSRLHSNPWIYLPTIITLFLKIPIIPFSYFSWKPTKKLPFLLGFESNDLQWNENLSGFPDSD